MFYFITFYNFLQLFTTFVPKKEHPPVLLFPISDPRRNNILHIKKSLILPCKEHRSLNRTLGKYCFWVRRMFDGDYLVFSLVSLLAMLFITAFDFYRVKKIASKGEQSNDLALYCAFNLYVDFIYILIRILSILARSKK